MDSEVEVPELEQTPLYAQDWIGLRALHESNKVAFVAVEGNHLSHLSMKDPLVTQVTHLLDFSHAPLLFTLLAKYVDF